MKDSLLLYIYALHPVMPLLTSTSLLFFFNDTATTEIYTLSLHDALPIFFTTESSINRKRLRPPFESAIRRMADRSEEHTSELQSQSNLVCRLLLEKKNARVLTSIKGPNGGLRLAKPLTESTVIHEV